MSTRSTFANPNLNFFQNYRNHLNAFVFNINDETVRVRRLNSLLLNLDKIGSLDDFLGISNYLDNKIETFSTFCCAYQMVLIERFLLQDIEQINPAMFKIIQSTINQIEKVNLYIEYLQSNEIPKKTDYENKTKILEGIKTELEGDTTLSNFIGYYNYIQKNTGGLDYFDCLNSKTFFSLYFHNEQDVVHEGKNFLQKYFMNNNKLKKYFFVLGLDSLFRDAQQGFIALYTPLIQFSLLKEMIKEASCIFINHAKTIIAPLYDGHDFIDEIAKLGISVCFAVSALYEAWKMITNCLKWIAVKIGIMEGNTDEITNNIQSSLFLAAGLSIGSVSLLLHSMLSIIVRPIVTVIKGWNTEDKLRFIDNPGSNESILSFIHNGLLSSVETDIPFSANDEAENSLSSGCMA